MAGVSLPAEEKTKPDVTAEMHDVDEEYASGARLVALAGSLMLGMFLVALDNVSPFVATVSLRRNADRTFCQTILSTAIPKITDQFHDLSKVSWYGAAYFMTFGGSESLQTCSLPGSTGR